MLQWLNEVDTRWLSSAVGGYMVQCWNLLCQLCLECCSHWVLMTAASVVCSWRVAGVSSIYIYWYIALVTTPPWLMWWLVCLGRWRGSDWRCYSKACPQQQHWAGISDVTWSVALYQQCHVITACLLCFNVNCNTAAQLRALIEVSVSLTVMIVNCHVSFLLLADMVNDVKWSMLRSNPSGRFHKVEAKPSRLTPEDWCQTLEADARRLRSNPWGWHQTVEAKPSRLTPEDWCQTLEADARRLRSDPRGWRQKVEVKTLRLRPKTDVTKDWCVEVMCHWERIMFTRQL